MLDWLGWLTAAAGDPFIYFPLLFIFAVLATVLLPIPVEVGLLNPLVPPVGLILTVAAGKAVGGALVFPLGARIGGRIDRELLRYPRLGRLYEWIERAVGEHGYWALFGLLAIPFMTDSVPVYAFSVFNPISTGSIPVAPSAGAGVGRFRKALGLGPFTLVNFAAGIVRCTAFLALPIVFGFQ